MNFELQPYIGAGSIRFGMSRAEINQLLGVPERSWTMRSGNVADSWPDLIVRYDEDSHQILEIEFTDTACVQYEDIDLFRDADAFSKLVKLDGAALKGTGTIVLLKLGISLTENLSDASAGDRTVCLFCRGRWDRAMGRLTPYEENR